MKPSYPEHQDSPPEPQRNSLSAGLILQGAILLAILIAGLYRPALQAPFLYSDEDRIFGYWTVDDMTVNAEDPYGATGTIFEKREPSDETSALRPPVMMYAMRAVYPVFKDHAPAYRTLALVLHGINCLLVFVVFFQAMSLGPPGREETRQARLVRAAAAFAGAILFAVHPAAGVSAIWLSALPQLLAATLILAAMALFLRNERTAVPSMGGMYLASMGVFGLAMLTCSNAVLLFLVPVAAAFCTRRPRERLLQPVARSLPFLVIGGGAVILYSSWKAYGGPAGPAQFDAAALFTQVGAYARAIVLVSDLPPVQPSVNPGTWTSAAVTGVFAVIVPALILAAGMMRRAWPALGLAMAWLLAAAVSHALVVQPFMGDPRPYLFYAAPALVLALALRAAAAPHGALSRKTALPVAAAFLVLAFSLISATRSLIPVFRSPTAFWSHLAEDTNRRNPRVLYQLSIAHVWENNYTTASSALEEAFKLTDPAKHREMRTNLANAMFILGIKKYHQFPDKYLEAESYLVKSINMDPYNPLPYSTMATIFMETSKNYTFAYTDILIALELAADKEPLETARRHILDQARKDGVDIDFKTARARADNWLRTIGVKQDPEPPSGGAGDSPRPGRNSGQTQPD